MKKQKILKVLSLISAFILICGVTVFANSLVGNPVSRLLATKGAEKHLETNYAEKDFVIEKVNYDFKIGGYYVKISSSTSIDSHFSLYFDFFGKLKSDSYDDVTSGWNTAMRIDTDYRNAVAAITNSSKYSEKYFISYGEIPFNLENYPIDEQMPEFSLTQKDLVLDKIYDVKEIGAKSGKLILCAYDTELTPERISELLLEVKSDFDKSGVTFKAVNLEIQPPKSEERPQPTDKHIGVINFYYSDIYEDGLLERVENAVELAEEYYKEQGDLKEQEINNVLNETEKSGK